MDKTNNMKQLFYTLFLVAWCNISIHAQTNQVVFHNGRVQYGHPVERIDSMVYDMDGLMEGDTLSLIVPRIVRVYDTVYVHKTDTIRVHDTIRTANITTRYTHACKEGYKDSYTHEVAPADKVFSIGRNTYVRLAPGNLQYQPSTNLWRFAPHQYDIIGKDNENIHYNKIAQYQGWFDCFSWGTGDEPTKYNAADQYDTFVDWGTNAIGTDSAGTWFTLTKDDWMYLIFKRPNAEQLVAGATIDSITGLILLPDSGHVPSSVTFHCATSQRLSNKYMDSNGNFFNHNTYTVEEWEQLEAVGAIFLPAKGHRSVFFWRDDGTSYYWATGIAESEEYGNALYMDKKFLMFYSVSRFQGAFVRLAKRVMINNE